MADEGLSIRALPLRWVVMQNMPSSVVVASSDEENPPPAPFLEVREYGVMFDFGHNEAHVEVMNAGPQGELDYGALQLVVGAVMKNYAAGEYRRDGG